MQRDAATPRLSLGHPGKAIAISFALLALPGCATAPPRDFSPTVEAAMPGGPLWSAEVPARWNGVVLLHSRGYSPVAGKPEAAPARHREALLARGFALVASNYGSGGWALEQAGPAQEAALSAFAARYGKPRRVIGYGFSMGGLVTTALVERPDPVIDGGIALCSSMGGTLGMMNMALDGAYAFRTLLAPDSAIRLTGISDDRANGALVQEVHAAAAATAAGRARITLAAVLGGIPGWLPAASGETPAVRRNAEVDLLVRSFVPATFAPRADQEARAGVGYSWNTGVDYAALLERSGRAEFVRQVYREAGADLERDLALLNAGPRLARDEKAADYMRRNYEPTHRPSVPLLAVQALGDTVTSPSIQRDYVDQASAQKVHEIYLEQPGHCAQTTEQLSQAIDLLLTRLETGDWKGSLSGSATSRPPPMPRSTR
ncbi:alpha/beta hydrolase family protein [Tsuneonella sp. HG222]